MKIDKKLNLVIPIETDDGTLYVHSMPIRREIFDTYFLVLSKTFAAIHGEGLGEIAGPRVAALILKKIAMDTGMWEGEMGVQRGLINEIHRQTNVLVLGDKGWQTVPYDEAISKQLISADDAVEVENAITFFIVSSAMHRRAMVKKMVEGAAVLWGGQISSLNCTEFASSLPTSTETVNSGETAKPLSVPS